MFRLKPTAEQGENYNDGTPFIQRLMEKTEQVQSFSTCSAGKRSRA